MRGKVPKAEGGKHVSEPDQSGADNQGKLSFLQGRVTPTRTLPDGYHREG